MAKRPGVLGLQLSKLAKDPDSRILRTRIRHNPTRDGGRGGESRGGGGPELHPAGRDGWKDGGNGTDPFAATVSRRRRLRSSFEDTAAAAARREFDLHLEKMALGQHRHHFLQCVPPDTHERTQSIDGKGRVPSPLLRRISCVQECKCVRSVVNTTSFDRVRRDGIP